MYIRVESVVTHLEETWAHRRGFGPAGAQGLGAAVSKNSVIILSTKANESLAGLKKNVVTWHYSCYARRWSRGLLTGRERQPYGEHEACEANREHVVGLPLPEERGPGTRCWSVGGLPCRRGEGLERVGGLPLPEGRAWSVGGLPLPEGRGPGVWADSICCWDSVVGAEQFSYLGGVDDAMCT